jgi:hypothetical protein
MTALRACSGIRILALEPLQGLPKSSNHSVHFLQDTSLKVPLLATLDGADTVSSVLASGQLVDRGTVLGPV